MTRGLLETGGGLTFTSSSKTALIRPDVESMKEASRLQNLLL